MTAYISLSVNDKVDMIKKVPEPKYFYYKM